MDAVVRSFLHVLRGAQLVRAHSESLKHMSTVLIMAGLGVVGTVVAALAVYYRSAQAADLGSVSHTWVAELRAGEPYDSTR